MTDATAGLLKPMRLDPTDRLQLDLADDGKHFRARIFGADYNGHRSWPSTNARLGWLERIPERKQLTAAAGDQWLVAATDYTAEVITAVWPREQLVVSDAAQKLIDYLLLSTARQDGVAEALARFKPLLEQSAAEIETAKRAGLSQETLDSLKEEWRLKLLAALPPEAHDLEVHPDSDLTLDPHQLFGLWASLQSEGYGLYMEQGTGKTPLVVAHVMNSCQAVRARHGRMYRGLVVVPKGVRLNWLKEFQRFCTRPGKVEVVRGGWAARAMTIVEACREEPDCEYSILVMSYESLKGSWDMLENIGWDLGVLDEAHYVKRPMTARSAYSRKLRDKCAKRMALTGTPISNTPLDLYALFEFLGEGLSGFQSWKAFKDFYGVYVEGGDGHQKLVAIQNKPFMKERLCRTAFCVTQREALPWLPEQTFDTLEAEMGPTQRQVYDQIAKELAVEIEGELETSENKSLTIQNILTQLLRLAQVACGFVSWDRAVDPETGERTGETRIEYFAENPKLETLIEALKERGPNEKTIIWSCFVPCIKQIAARLEKEGIRYAMYYGQTSDEDREEAERAYNCDADCTVFLGNQAAGGTGLNLLGYPPHAGEGVATNTTWSIYYAVDWSYVKRSQSGKRNHRRGTRVPQRETDLVVPETIDEDIRVRVMEKKLVAMDIADVRDILAAVLKGVGRGQE